MRRANPLIIDDAAIIIIIAVAAASAGVAKAVRDTRKAARKAREARLAQVRRFQARFEQEAAISATARAKVVQTVPWIAGGLVAAGLAYALTPAKGWRR